MFGRFFRFLSDARELGRFKRLLKELNAPSLGRDNTAALDEFAGWMASREGLVSVLRAHGYSSSEGKAKLIELYSTLLMAGAGQWVGTTYVATVALHDPHLLDLLLDIERGDHHSYKDMALTMATAALDYVEAKARKA